MLDLAAEVERLWSIVDRHVDENRNSTTPLLMETMVFLRMNKEFWNDETIVKDYSNALQEDRSTRSESMLVEDYLCVANHDY